MSIAWAAVSNADAGTQRYYGICGAWLVALLFALLMIWMRGTIGERSRRTGRPEERYTAAGRSVGEAAAKPRICEKLADDAGRRR